MCSMNDMREKRGSDKEALRDTVRLRNRERKLRG